MNEASGNDENSASSKGRVVVARMKDYSLSPHAVQSQQALLVRTEVNPGLMTDFMQTICDTQGKPLAQATVTCLALSPLEGPRH